jgi:hypothetical protein
MAMRHLSAKLTTILSVSAFMAIGACKEPDLSGGKRNRTRIVKANIAEFDPNADVDLDAYFGSERPDEYAMEQAFNQTFDAMDQCVVKAKDKLGVGKDKALDGEIKFGVKLNPKSSRPDGVNAELPKKYAKNKDFQNCMREAVAAAPYPTYKGPPVIVNFETEIDPGTEMLD